MEYTTQSASLVAQIAASLASDLTATEDIRADAFPDLGDDYGWDVMFLHCADLADAVVRCLLHQHGTLGAFWQAWSGGETYQWPGVFLYDISAALIAQLRSTPFNTSVTYTTADLDRIATAALTSLRKRPPAAMTEVAKILLT